VFDLLGWSRANIHGYTMPGYGTTSHTKKNAHKLMKQLGITSREVDIRLMCLEQMRATGHKPFGLALLPTLTVSDFVERLGELEKGAQDLEFENVQARMRTNILMNKGFQIGTGDLSELALGWCTFGADHLSSYNPNGSIPKTLVKFLVSWAAQNQFEGEARETLLDICDTAISPELLPLGKDGESQQQTENSIGPYELHDFSLLHFLRYGASPEKILYLASHAKFDREYSEAEKRKWLEVFITRFFGQQYKRSCLPNGPKVGSVSFSPRGDWRMPSDAQVDLWLQWAQ
jgi:NAD+ synthase (glutamine-hydrolysing)